jgi:phage-related protein
MPSDWKPLKSVGVGVAEIRIHTQREHRVVYVAHFAEQSMCTLSRSAVARLLGRISS